MDADDIARYLTLAAEAKVRAEQATPGPWDQPDRAWCDLGEVWPAARQSTHDEMAIAYDITRPADVAFIAAARTDIPALATAVEALVAEMRRLTEQRSLAKAKLLVQLQLLKHSGDWEQAHIAADQLLLGYVDDAEIAEAYRQAPKWYS